MAAANTLLGVTLREATQRKLQRFSELRGSKEETPAFPGSGQGGYFTCREIC